MKQMSRRERILAAINREPVDRVPYAVWRHFPAVDRSPAGLAQATLRFHERYGSDFVKLTPRGGYAVEAWGCVEGEVVREDGHRPCASCAIRGAEDWKKIRPLDPGAAPGYTEHIETIVRMGFDRRIGDAPVLPTLFSPLSLARKLSGDRLPQDLREHPDLVRGALEAITETLVRFAALALAEGVSGIFYSIQAASLSVNTEEAYARFGEPYDRQVLESVRGKSLLTIVHCHGDRLMFERLAPLPGNAWNWDDRATPPSLAEAKAKTVGAVIGGLDQWKTLRDGTPEQAAAEARDAVAQTGGIGLIVGPGCVLPANTPDANVAAVVQALGGPLKKIPGVTP
ncbi:MAG: uroporphyrinogen decarboxylase [candidate division NC10 bacterium]|nr:uroporphyrinogen decarboxylase [Candidatus Rokubacteria bacterium]MBI2564250.1 uroporphyrinogen decarboxylase [candidate division NC10 bacterium]